MTKGDFFTQEYGGMHYWEAGGGGGVHVEKHIELRIKWCRSQFPDL